MGRLELEHSLLRIGRKPSPQGSSLPSKCVINMLLSPLQMQHFPSPDANHWSQVQSRPPVNMSHQLDLLLTC